MAEDASIITDLTHTSAFDALRLIVARAQLMDDSPAQLCVIVGAIAMLAGTVRAALVDQDPREGEAGTANLWNVMFDAARAKPMMEAVFTLKTQGGGAR